MTNTRQAEHGKEREEEVNQRWRETKWRKEEDEGEEEEGEEEEEEIRNEKGG